MIDDSLSLYSAIALPKGVQLHRARYGSSPMCAPSCLSSVAVPPKVCMILKYGKDCYPRDVFCSSAPRSSLITILLLHPVFLRHKTHLVYTLNWKIWNPTSILLSRRRRRTTRRRRHSNPRCEWCEMKRHHQTPP